MGRVGTPEERMNNLNKILEEKGSNVRVVRNYINLTEKAIFKCLKCNGEFEEKAFNIKQTPVCRCCEVKPSKKQLLQNTIEEEGNWIVVGSVSDKFTLQCVECGEIAEYTMHQIRLGRHICNCKEDKPLSFDMDDVEKQALNIYTYMIRDIEEYGMLVGEELESYIEDIIRIDRETLKNDEEFIEAVKYRVDYLYEKKHIEMCKECKRLFPRRHLYKGVCYTPQAKKHCTAS